eukprot:5187982-Amphidinium_carterae.2
MSLPLTSRLYAWGKIGGLFGCALSQAMRTLGLHPGHLTPVGAGADIAVVNSKTAVTAVHTCEAGVASDLAELVGRG